MTADQLTRIAREIRKHLPDAKIILFGSHARGDALKTSDIDIIIVSAKFRDMHFTQRASYILRLLYQAGALPPTGLDILCYTPEEFEKKTREIGTIKDALTYAKEL